MDLGLEGRVALVVGGGRGIGRAVARALGREGADVGVLARTGTETAAVVAEIHALGRQSIALAADVTDSAARTTALDALVRQLGPPTVLVLAVAAVYVPKKLQFVEDAEAQHLLDTDLRATVDLCRWALPAMMEARFGRIVAVGSVAAQTGVAGGSLYAAGKAAVEGLMRGIAVDYSRRGITANVAQVSFAETERLQSRVAGDEAARERLVKATSTRRIPTADEVADAVVFLCSARASAITGSVLQVTAGAHLNNLW